MNDRFPIKEIADNFAKVLRTASQLLGNDALNFFLNSFKKQGWQGASFQAWAPRRNVKNAKGRAILVQSGRLRRSLQLTSVTDGSFTIGTDVPYAQIHNEGGTINKSARQHVLHFKKTKEGTRFSKVKQASFAQKVNIGAHSIKMPKRQFMGESPILTKQLVKKLTNELMKANQSTI